MYALDTNAILYYLKDDVHAVPVLRQVFAQNTTIHISAITELELFAFANLSAQEESLIEDLLLLTLASLGSPLSPEKPMP